MLGGGAWREERGSIQIWLLCHGFEQSDQDQILIVAIHDWGFRDTEAGSRKSHSPRSDLPCPSKQSRCCITAFTLPGDPTHLH